KLPQEAQVIAPVEADVVDTVLELRHPLRPHAEGEAGELLRVVAAVAQHHRVDHARSHDLQPAAALAHGAAALAAQDAVHIHFDARRREWEVPGADAYLPVGAEQFAGQRHDGAFQVGHRHARADRQALDLEELDLATDGDLLVAVAHAGKD